MAKVIKSKKPSSYKEIECRECGNTMTVASDAVAGVCWRCLNFPKSSGWKLQGSFTKGSNTK